MDSPENLFGYADFDNTTKESNVGSCKGILHTFAPHVSDWQSGDPEWGSGRGHGLIGLLNYIASTGVNAVYMVIMSVNGDGCDGHPWTDYYGDRRAFDVSKLDQWERAFGHMTHLGLMIHIVTQETENDQLLDGGALGVERNLYYRELISRFGHHPALQWNLGEENTNTTDQAKQFADFIRLLDPHDHPIAMHTYPEEHAKDNDMLGHASFGAEQNLSPAVEDAAVRTGRGVAAGAVDLSDGTAEEQHRTTDGQPQLDASHGFVHPSAGNDRGRSL